MADFSILQVDVGPWAGGRRPVGCGDSTITSVVRDRTNTPVAGASAMWHPVLQSSVNHPPVMPSKPLEVYLNHAESLNPQDLGTGRYTRAPSLSDLTLVPSYRTASRSAVLFR
jgi:hypothetical protein